jgi:hypothetical protein
MSGEDSSYTVKVHKKIQWLIFPRVRLTNRHSSHLVRGRRRELREANWPNGWARSNAKWDSGGLCHLAYSYSLSRIVVFLHQKGLERWAHVSRELIHVNERCWQSQPRSLDPRFHLSSLLGAQLCESSPH